MLLLAVGAKAQSADFSAKIVDGNGNPLPHVLVKINDRDLRVRSDENGEFEFANLPAGEYELDIELSKREHFNSKIVHRDEAQQTINVDKLALDTLVVSANPLEHSQLKMTAPVTILSEEELIMSRSLSIEQTLKQITGVNSGSFGAGAGQVVIRGQQGPRVTILNDSVAMQDASTVSADHWISTEPLLAKQVEVLKGPATLLYGGGAVGGVVNVIDEVIPETQIDGVKGAFETRLSDGTRGERAGVLELNAALSDNLMTHLSYFKNRTDDYKIPGFAESKYLREQEEEHEHGEGEGEHEHEEEEEAYGVLENSSVKTQGYNIGFSWVGDRGYWGVSLSDLDRNYGIPGHEHHHEDEHGTTVKEDHDHDHEHADVRIQLDKSVFSLKGAHDFAEGLFVEQLKTHYSRSDYQHTEIEGSSVGTLFDNQSQEFRLELTHSHLNGFRGVWGVQFSDRDFSAVGEEAFILPSTTKIASLFIIEERDFDRWHGELGLRFDRQNISTTIYPDVKADVFSAAIGATLNINRQWTMPINLTRAQRLPTAEELFSNRSGATELIPHLAAGVIEIGDINLKQETANNIDWGIKFRGEIMQFNLALFYNQVNDFIYLKNSGEEHEEVPIFHYRQADASFRGFETDFSWLLRDRFENQWLFKVFADSTRAKLKNGGNLPRIPSNRLGLGVNWTTGAWSFGLNWTHAQKQTRLAVNELPSNAYDDVDLTVNWLNQGQRLETLIFLKANNLLDEEIREHASFTKDLAPLPGRNLTLGLRLNF